MEKPLKLTLNQLKNYLGTGLEINNIWITAYGGFSRKELEVSVLYHSRFDQIVPHCYQLTDLDKFIPSLGFVPLQELFQLCYESIYMHRFEGTFEDDKILGENLACVAYEVVNNTSYRYGMTLELPNQFLFSVNGDYCTIPNFTIYQKLFEWHFWPFDQKAFDEGLVIDKLTYDGK